jgi:hypothetical protein
MGIRTTIAPQDAASEVQRTRGGPNDGPPANGRGPVTTRLDRTDKKLREAEFFLDHLIAENSLVPNRHPEAADFYLSGFLTAARSVMFILRIENPDEYELRSRNWFARLPVEDRDLVDFLANQRNNAQKEGATDGTFTNESLIEFMQDVCGWGVNILVADGVVGTPQLPFTQSETRVVDRPDTSIDVGCRTYLGLLKLLVAEFEREDPSV